MSFRAIGEESLETLGILPPRPRGQDDSRRVMYEITYLEKPGTEPYDISKAILDLGGAVVSSKTLGEKSLAYPIKKQNRAVFTTLVFNLPVEEIEKFKNQLNSAENILRYLIIKGAIESKPLIQRKKEVKKPQEAKKPESEVIESKEMEEKIPSPPVAEKEPVKKPKKIEKIVEKPKAVKAEAEEAIAAKTLDETLDELLKE